jgi:type I restriction enzyme, S subunit
MNAERLLDLYGRIADAPDAVARLRRFILDLAVRGKLVPQDPNDEPASELLKRIAKEKLDQGGLPQGWRRAKVGSILDFQYGKGLKAADRLDEGPVPVFGSNGIVGFTGEPLTASPSIIVGRKGSAGALNLCDGPSWTTDVAYFVEAPSFLDLRFLLNALASLNLNKLGKGVKPGLSRSEAYEQVLTLPPLAEQHRIAAKVDELMGLCDRLETARKAREETRDRLAAASLARLNAPAPETFADDARFVINALPALTARPDQIKQLRQTILNLAVRGKLAPQDPNDEPASELLKRIAKEKARLVKAGEIRKEKPEPPFSDSDYSFELPIRWEWVRLGSLSRIVTSGSRDWAQHYSSEGAIFVRMGNLSKDHYRLRLDNIQHVNPPTDGEGLRTRLEAGDILISITGDVGMLGLIPENFGEAYINQHTAMVRPMPEIKGRYLAELFRSPFAQDQFNEPQRGIKNSFRLTDVTQFIVPLPPLAEQHRIIAKVDELMALCDQLEQSLSSAAAARRGLLEALLAEATAPAAADPMAA